ncbi:hypothetical protein [Saccharothrix sp. Mg75]|uniref:hypothetical protein n=1 Tax=Saccharothrix sp. Mg75 TaxID=3445357 RepID=UPI003EE905EC
MVNPTSHSEPDYFTGRHEPGPGTVIGILLCRGFSLLDPTGPAGCCHDRPAPPRGVIAERQSPVRTDTGHTVVVADRLIDEVDAPDVLLVPGATNEEWS